MQSGSGLAHWSFLYETHLIEKATKSPQLYDAIDFKFVILLNSHVNIISS